MQTSGSTLRILWAWLGLLGALCFPPAATAQTALPALPDFIKSHGVLRAGVRCDQPPYGFQDQNGKFAGVEVEMAMQMAAWAFGGKDKIELTCVTAENRIPQLNGKKVDLLIATLGITPERARVVDFSDAYRWGGSDLLVPKNSPIRKIDDVDGRTVIMLKGTTQAKWFEENKPKVQTLKLNTASDALQALKQGRGDAYTHDAATLIVMAAKDPELRLVGELFANADTAIGVRKNEGPWLAYINAALGRMKQENLFLGWVTQWVAADIRSYYIQVFTKPKPASR
ncbi:MAG TPA: transporter substrate-binding domain-containing protein [Candidatus Methylomirabilis sp.]|nr:transporter substrate-binding domain-containing protein [Candidatus Methylomirabilis sp.]